MVSYFRALIFKYDKKHRFVREVSFRLMCDNKQSAIVTMTQLVDSMNDVVKPGYYFEAIAICCEEVHS